MNCTVARTLDKDGYGLVKVGKLTRRAHRVAWELANGPVPVGLSVLHACDNRACVEPEHLFLGTQADNVVDMDRKVRRAPSSGAANGRAVLDEARAGELRRLWSDGLGSPALARLFGVSRSQAWRVATGRQWA